MIVIMFKSSLLKIVVDLLQKYEEIFKSLVLIYIQSSNRAYGSGAL